MSLFAAFVLVHLAPAGGFLGVLGSEKSLSDFWVFRVKRQKTRQSFKEYGTKIHWHNVSAEKFWSH